MFIKKWMRAWWHPRIDWEPWFPDSLKGPNIDYCKYVVLGTGRSGSSLLVSSLRSHPAILSFSELFHPTQIQFNTPEFNNHNGELLRLRMRHTAEFLGNVIYRPVATSIQAVGFKVFYTHLYDVPDLERFLLAHDDIRIVHLKRRNLLHTFISSRIAAKTNVYGISSADAIQKTTIVVDTDKCLRYLQDQQQAIARYDTLLRDRSVLDVQYTDLSDSYESTMARVQAFLDVEPRTLSSSRVKQNPYSLREIVENYDELEEALRGLPWEEFLVS